MKWFGRKAARRPGAFSVWGWRGVYGASRGRAAMRRRCASLSRQSGGSGRCGWWRERGLEPRLRRRRTGGAAALVPPALLETVATQLLLHGNAFVQRAEARGAARRIVRIAARGSAWRRTDRGGRRLCLQGRLGQERIAAKDGAASGAAHLKAAHPLDDHMA